MAFVGAGRRAAAQRLLQAQTEAMMASYSDNAMFTREVGHPVALALQAFGDCNYDDTVRRLRSLGNADKAQSASHRPDKRRRNDVPAALSGRREGGN